MLLAIVPFSRVEELSLFNSEVKFQHAHLASGLKQYSPFSLISKKAGIFISFDYLLGLIS